MSGTWPWAGCGDSFCYDESGAECVVRETSVGTPFPGLSFPSAVRGCGRAGRVLVVWAGAGGGGAAPLQVREAGEWSAAASASPSKGREGRGGRCRTGWAVLEARGSVETGRPAAGGTCSPPPLREQEQRHPRAASTPALRSRFPAATRRLAKARSWAGVRKHKALSTRREVGGGAWGGQVASLLQATSAAADCTHG